jgi:PAS domain S-box-containing protein
MGKDIRILFIEDSEDDALLLLNEIRRGGFEPVSMRVETETDLRHALDYTEWDLIISDEQMPHFNATEALKISRESGKGVPFIIVSGVIEEDTAINAMRSGAHDFINKSNLKRLVPAIEREMAEAAEKKQRKHAEVALQKSESKYRMLFEKMMNAFALQEDVRDENGRTVDFLYIDGNDAYAAMAGMAREKLIGKTLREIDPSAGDELTNRYNRISMTGDADHFEYYSDTFKKYFEVSAYRPREGLVASVIRDISLKKITEERQDLIEYILQTINRENNTQAIILDILSLLKNHYRFDAVALRLRKGDDYPYFLHDGFSENFIESESSLCAKYESGDLITDNEGKPRLACLCGLVISGKNGSARSLLTAGGSFWTNGASKLLEYAAEELSGVGTRNLCMKEGYESMALIPLRSGDDTIGLLQFNDRRKNRFTLDQIEFLESVGLTVGIALKRRRIEEEIRKSEEKHRTLFETMAQGVIYQSSDGTITSVNPAAERILGLALDQILGRTSLDPGWHSIHEDGTEYPGETHPSMVALHTGHEQKNIIMGVFNPALGEYQWIKIHAIPQFRPGEDRPYQVYTTFDDITEIKRAEVAMTASLREKEALLKEIHHRVKNNLQVISSLISLQALSINDGAAATAFQDIQNRIKSMAIIHEHLYLSKNFASIAFGDYIGDIVHSLFQSFDIIPGRIVFRTDIKDISLGIDTAVPCGLIINELVTNSLKHAFPDGRKGEIFIAMARDKKGGYILSIKDNGTGTPQQIDLERTPTLGLRLVNILAQQINGRIEVRGNGGIEFILQFSDAAVR